MSAQRVPLRPMMISALVGAILTTLVFLAVRKNQVPPVSSTPEVRPEVLSAARVIESLLSPPSIPDTTDIAVLNLACCPALGDSPGKAMGAYLKTLDQWASAVGEVTSKNFHRHIENPTEFNNEAEWRLAMMCTVLGQDFKVRYDPALTSTVAQTASNSQFFANAEAVFLTGCLNDSRSGTCASLPVLYVAIGRRLGYPMYLVSAKGHLFARWDDGKGTRVNLEAANGGGFSSHPDAYYRTWPFPLTAKEEKTGGYLQNLDAAQMLAIFLSTRAECLKAGGKPQEAMTAASAAYRLAPKLAGMADSLQVALLRRPDATTAEILHERETNRMLRQRDVTIPGLPPDPLPGMPNPSPRGIPVNPGFPTQGVHSAPGQPVYPHQPR
jgi:hypothetical protein